MTDLTRRRLLTGFLLCLLWSSVAEALDPSTVVTVRSAFGSQLAPTYPNTVVTGVQIIDVSPGSITLGRFRGGRVIDGDAVLVVFLHLGSAPVAEIALGASGIVVTTATPIDEGAPDTVGLVLPPDFPAFEPNFPGGTAATGAEGEFFIALALLEHRLQSLTEALGVTIPYRVRIGEPSGFLQDADGSLFFERVMTRGGAAQFRRFKAK